MSIYNLLVHVIYLDINGGFWGLIDAKQNQFLPINFPEQLKIKDKKINVSLRKRDDMMSMHNWGTLVEITAFETI